MQFGQLRMAQGVNLVRGAPGGCAGPQSPSVPLIAVRARPQASLASGPRTLPLELGQLARQRARHRPARQRGGSLLPVSGNIARPANQRLDQFAPSARVGQRLLHLGNRLVEQERRGDRAHFA